MSAAQITGWSSADEMKQKNARNNWGESISCSNSRHGYGSNQRCCHSLLDRRLNMTATGHIESQLHEPQNHSICHLYISVKTTLRLPLPVFFISTQCTAFMAVAACCPLNVWLEMPGASKPISPSLAQCDADKVMFLQVVSEHMSQACVLSQSINQ